MTLQIAFVQLKLMVNGMNTSEFVLGLMRLIDALHLQLMVII